jgi:hypothetical protein
MEIAWVASTHFSKLPGHLLGLRAGDTDIGLMTNVQMARKPVSETGTGSAEGLELLGGSRPGHSCGHLICDWVTLRSSEESRLPEVV